MASRSDNNAEPTSGHDDGKSSADSQPSQPSQSSQPSQPSQPSQSSQPSQPSQSSGHDASERSALIRKTPFVAYTAAAIFTIYILAQPDSLGDLLVPTVVAGLVFAIGYMTWSELRD